VPITEAPPTIVFLHGYGADEYDLLSFADAFDPRFLTISFQGPYALPQGGRSWYDLRATLTGFTPDDQTRFASETLLAHDLPEIVKLEGGDLQNIFILGFSQGAAMTYSLVGKGLLNQDEVQLRGIITLSGYIPEDTKYALQTKDLSGSRFFVGHGLYDELIPSAAADIAEGILTSAKASVEKRLYPIPHAVSEPELTDVASWLARILE
jgi:phospholipase/carboxylesterase